MSRARSQRCNRDELLPEADGDDPLRDLSELERKGLQEMTIGVPKVCGSLL